MEISLPEIMSLFFLYSPVGPNVGLPLKIKARCRPSSPSAGLRPTDRQPAAGQPDTAGRAMPRDNTGELMVINVIARDRTLGLSFY